MKVQILFILGLVALAVALGAEIVYRFGGIAP